MKRSEFISRLNDREDPWVTSVVELTEAAGVTWDPEELAEMKLYAVEGPSGYRISAGDTAEPYPFSRAQADEVIRRYEALPVIEAAFRRWQATEYGDRFEDGLFAGVIEGMLGKEGS